MELPQTQLLVCAKEINQILLAKMIHLIAIVVCVPIKLIATVIPVLVVQTCLATARAIVAIVQIHTALSIPVILFLTANSRKEIILTLRFVHVDLKSVLRTNLGVDIMYARQFLSV